jgi:NADH-quinone oxidoreductase subunit J
MINLLFYFFSSFSIVFSLAVIVSKNPVHSVLSLILVFFNVAGFFVILGAEFLALLFIVVYVGAVAVLFLFVIMMLDIKFVSLNFSMYRYILIFFVFGFIFFFNFFFIFFDDLISIKTRYNFLSFFVNYFLSVDFISNWCSFVMFSNNLIIFSYFIYTYYFFPFVISSIILLISMIGAISLTLHRRNDVKRQFIYKQINRTFSNSIVWKN